LAALVVVDLQCQGALPAVIRQCACTSPINVLITAYEWEALDRRDPLVVGHGCDDVAGASAVVDRSVGGGAW
jgi:hypothetical protein